MRKIHSLVVVLVMLVLALPASAQLRFGVKAGVNIADASLSWSALDKGNVTGFHVGPSLEMGIPLTGLNLDLSVLYSQKGVKVDDLTMKTDYLDVPLYLKWKIGLPIVKVFLQAGPYVSFRVAGDKLLDVPSKVIDDVKSKSFGAGLNFGFGVEVFKHLQVSANYGLGLTNNFEAFKAEDLISKGKNRVWSVTAGYYF